MASNYDPKINRFRHVRYNTGPDFETLSNAPVEDAMTKEQFFEHERGQINRDQFMLANMFLVGGGQYLVSRIPLFMALNGKMRGVVRCGIFFAGLYGIQRTFEKETKERKDGFYMDTLKQYYENPISQNFKY